MYRLKQPWTATYLEERELGRVGMILERPPLWHEKINLGSLSTRDFEKRTASGSALFSLITVRCLAIASFRDARNVLTAAVPHDLISEDD